jgi:hypothetical protein
MARRPRIELATDPEPIAELRREHAARFHAVATDGQVVELLLAVPEALRDEFFLPVEVERPRPRKKPKGS